MVGKNVYMNFECWNWTLLLHKWEYWNESNIVCTTFILYCHEGPPVYEARSHYHCKYYHRPVITKVSQSQKKSHKKQRLCFWVKIYFQARKTININQSMFSEIKVQVTYQRVHDRIFQRKINIFIFSEGFSEEIILHLLHWL